MVEAGGGERESPESLHVDDDLIGVPVVQAESVDRMGSGSNAEGVRPWVLSSELLSDLELPERRALRESWATGQRSVASRPR